MLEGPGSSAVKNLDGIFIFKSILYLPCQLVAEENSVPGEGTVADPPRRYYPYWLSPVVRARGGSGGTSLSTGRMLQNVMWALTLRVPIGSS